MQGTIVGAAADGTQQFQQNIASSVASIATPAQCRCAMPMPYRRGTG